MATATFAAALAFIGTYLLNVHSSLGRFQARFGAPEWLDRSLVGDYGFDLFELGKSAEYLQFELDSLDQNLAKNLAGELIRIRECFEVKPTPF
ncbi:hypothetical protein SLEP1_g32788 [Rubroshorea leprosula]|uniref:Uncharacterized protein n=1 Tax=Rubroshorea leprosula TaxID=152421 RepID=A0AAV5KEI2_9ROSI|nr:hypothetical protein SLEP1_g32788 [Rubroshorea leprosula]